MLGWNLFGNYILWNEGPEKSNKDQTTDQFSKNCAQNKYQVVQNWVHVGQGLRFGNYIFWNEGPEKSNKDQTTDQFSKNCAQNKYQVVQNWVHVGQG